MAALEAKLAAYVQTPAAAAEPLDLTTVPKISKEQARQEAIRESSFVVLMASLRLTNSPQVHVLKLQTHQKLDLRLLKTAAAVPQRLLHLWKTSSLCTANSWRQCPSSPNTALSSRAAQSRSSSRKAKPNTSLLASSIYSRSTLFSRYVQHDHVVS